jgi:hypothetical protein
MDIVLQNDLLRLLAFGLLALLGGLLLRAWGRSKGEGFPKGWGACLGLVALLAACLYVAISYLPEISTYPLSLTWSEASRYYYASLFFAERIYGVSAPPTVLHPSRYLMQAVPFLIPNSPLWLHRLWQVFLWLATPALTAYVLGRRLPFAGRSKKLAFWAAVFLFLTVGPIYYHLLVPAILVLWGFRAGHPAASRKDWIISICAVLLASAWAGISRINWFPVPGVLAATLILLESPLLPVTGDPSAKRVWPWRSILAYFLRLAGWVIAGLGVALAAQVLYIAWSGNAAEQFTSSFTSDLLWSRLLPNSTYPPGIFLAILVVSLPLVLLILSRLVEGLGHTPFGRRYHPLRLLALAAILLVFFAGGLVVSVKIGGGSNIHNMDAYIVLSLVVAAYFYAGAVASDVPPSLPETPGGGEGPAKEYAPVQAAKPLRSFGLALAVIVPVAFTVFFRAPIWPVLDRQDAENAIQTIAYYAENVSQRGGEVLFISNRHLLTFGYVKGVRLIPEYERVFLMEMAMARDPVALGRFHDDLKKQRYALIVSEPLSRQQKGAEDIFGAENDVWVKQVTRYILCYYEPEKTLRVTQIQLLVPRAALAPECP